MTEETQTITSAEPKPTVARKTTKAKKKSKAKKIKKDSHEGRPKSSLTYWKHAIENNKLRGEDLAYAIKQIEQYEKKKEQERLNRAKPNPSSKLRSILEHSTQANDSQLTEPNAEVAKVALNAKPQAQEAPSEETDALEPAPLTFADLMAEITKPTGKTREEEIAEIAKRLREVPAPGYDSATETRIWAAVHAMKVR